MKENSIEVSLGKKKRSGLEMRSLREEEQKDQGK